MTHRFWCGTIGCTFATHGATGWIGFGGALNGNSAPRIAFLKKILEASPPEGLDPIDQDFEPEVAAQAGDYYLIYFGKETPKKWKFQLYKRNLADGVKFKVDVIDTWNMTIKPVRGEFVTKKQDDYYFADASGRSVSLPRKPGIVLRIQRVGDNPTGNKPEDVQEE